MLERAGGRDPVSDLGVAGLELGGRQRGQRVPVLLGEKLEHVPVQLLVDGEVAESTRGHDPDALA